MLCALRDSHRVDTVWSFMLFLCSVYLAVGASRCVSAGWALHILRPPITMGNVISLVSIRSVTMNVHHQWRYLLFVIRVFDLIRLDVRLTRPPISSNLSNSSDPINFFLFKSMHKIFSEIFDCNILAVRNIFANCFIGKMYDLMVHKLFAIE